MSVEEEKSKGVTAFREQDFDGAIYHFSEALNLGPSNETKATLLGNRAAAFEKIGDFQSALEDSVNALKAQPTYLKAYFRQATSLIELGRHREAIEAAEIGLQRAPNNSQLKDLKAKAEELLEEEEDGEEEEDEEEEEEDEEEDGAEESGASSPFGRMNVDSGRSSSGRSPGGGSNASSPAEQAEEAKAAGNVEYKAGRYESAISFYGKAIRLAPSNPTYLINRAAAALMLQQSQDALDDSNKALSLDPSLAKAHSRAAKALCQLGRLSDARRQLETAVTFGEDPTLATELASLTELETQLRQAKDVLSQEGGSAAREALRLFTILSERCPCSEAIACQQMDALLRAQPANGPSQVIAESARWLRKHGDNPDLLCVRGKALYKSGQIEAGLKHFAEALRLDPDHAGSRTLRKQLKELERAKDAAKESFQAGRFEEAAQRYTEAMALDPDNVEVAVTLLSNRATSKFKLGDYAGAVSDCNTALETQPRHLKCLLRRGACHTELEEWQKAIDDYERAHEVEPDDPSIKQSLRNAKVELKKSKRKDLYKLLGITRRATDHEIKKAYKKMALQYHPDRHSGASDEEKAEMEKKFKELGEAFEILSDPEKKQRWDQGESLEEINGNGGGGRGGGMGGMDPSDIFRAYASRGGGGGFPGGFGGFH